MPSDFKTKDIPHYPGHMVTIRAFQMDIDGMIHSPTMHECQWREGENVASCNRNAAWRIMAPGRYTAVNNMAFPSSPHDVAQKDCSCGFYSYFSDEHACGYLPPLDGVIGLIKAYGRCTVGTYGATCEKAEIIALIEEDKDPDAVAPPDHPDYPEYHNTKPYLAVQVFFISVQLLTWLLPLFGLFESSVLSKSIGWGFWTGWLVTFLLLRRKQKQNKAMQDRFGKEVDAYIDALSVVASTHRRIKRTRQQSDTVQAVKDRYPHIPWFDSIDEALEAFPLSHPEGYLDT